MAKAAASRGEVVPLKPAGGLATIDDALAKEFDGVHGAGQSDHIEDRGTPLLYIAQKGSPQVDKNHPMFIPGLEVGMAFNNLTGDMWDAENEGVPFYPCFHRFSYIEWRPDRGGFAGRHERMTDQEVMHRYSAKRWVSPQSGKERNDVWELPDGNLLAKTMEYFGLVGPMMAPIIVSMASTNLKGSQQLQNLLGKMKAQRSDGSIVEVPAYFLEWRLKTVYVQDGPNSWYRWAPVLNGSLSNAEDITPANIRELCKAFNFACQEGTVKVSEPPQESGLGSSAGSRDAPI